MISQAPEPQSVERPETIRGDERASTAGYLNAMLYIAPSFDGGLPWAS